MSNRSLVILILVGLLLSSTGILAECFSQKTREDALSVDVKTPSQRAVLSNGLFSIFAGDIS
jgi:hypothetical protein